jgi:photosystem II stability/assembly factor-like uncharacterized protein
VFHSRDHGKSWIVAETPILHGAPSQGIFSLVFWSHKDGIVVGGDYKEPAQSKNNAAVTHDGGKTWTLSSRAPAGYRSAVALQSGQWVASLVSVGTTGEDTSMDGGETWHLFARPELNGVSYADPANGWAVGPHGLIIRAPVLTID